MPRPQPPRGDPLDEAMLAWAQATAHLAATCRNQPLHPPQLTVCQAQRCGLAAAALAVAYWWWARTYHCAFQWHFAFEIHPMFRAIHWMTAAGVSVIWQLWDRLKVVAPMEPPLHAVPRRDPRMDFPRTLSG